VEVGCIIWRRLVAEPEDWLPCIEADFLSLMLLSYLFLEADCLVWRTVTLPETGYLVWRLVTLSRGLLPILQAGYLAWRLVPFSEA
jgi:hypothetical protein